MNTTSTTAIVSNENAMTNNATCWPVGAPAGGAGAGNGPATGAVAVAGGGRGAGTGAVAATGADVADCVECGAGVAKTFVGAGVRTSAGSGWAVAATGCGAAGSGCGAGGGVLVGTASATIDAGVAVAGGGSGGFGALMTILPVTGGESLASDSDSGMVRLRLVVPDMTISILRRGGLGSAGMALVGGVAATATAGGALVSGGGRAMAVCGTVTEAG